MYVFLFRSSGVILLPPLECKTDPPSLLLDPKVTKTANWMNDRKERGLGVPCCHQTEMLEVSTHPFHSIELLVQRVVVVAEDRTVRPRWDYHQGPGLLNPFDQLIRIIALRDEQPFSDRRVDLWQCSNFIAVAKVIWAPPCWGEPSLIIGHRQKEDLFRRSSDVPLRQWELMQVPQACRCEQRKRTSCIVL